MAGTLYLVPTPIGNLGDISLRMKETLQNADFIAAEDTRVTGRLLNYLEIRKPMVSYYRHNQDRSGPEILARILAGETCALVTDAGTPGISDPGEDLVSLCAENGAEIIAVPGPCAMITALSVSGLPTGRFTFEGFLPQNRKNRWAQLDSLRSETRTMVFYEAPHKLLGTLEDLRETFGPDRRMTVCRELTKLHEQILRTTLQEALTFFSEQGARGEFVLVVEGAQPEKQAPDLEGAADRVEELRSSGMSRKEAAAQAAEEFGVRKNQLYEISMEKTGKKP